MSRNAKFDLAKRQAMGIYRPSTGNTDGDIRMVEGSKAFYISTKLEGDADLIAAYQGAIVQCPEAMNSSGRYVKYDFNAKRSGACPQCRGELVPGEAVRATSVVRWAR